MNKVNKPFVSIIIPTYNAARTIVSCIDSALAQNYPNDRYEIIIVDDASTDNTPEILERYQDNHRVLITRHSENRALAATRNTGIRLARGEILLFIDADIELMRDFISQHVQYFEDTTVIGVLSQLHPDPLTKYNKYQRYLYESRRGAKKFPPHKSLPFQTFLFTASSLRKSIIEQVGLFDENIIRYGGEDTDYAYRISKQYPDGFYYAPEIDVIHHHYRPFEDVLTKVTDFGKNVVPYLVNQHPEFKTLYGYSFIFSSNFLKTSFGKIFKSTKFFALLKFCYRLFPFPISNLFIRLLLLSSLWQGLSSSERQPL